ncbi:uncharacterized protein LOC130987074 isoform X3 [Salvia miltiorrhiza]|uniref:uncharacterized protein LOC130987074 isoform X3 n=1 Tax=Salvia miltiorrhiza TaxID=226208 RepID=UPI0025AC0FD6|nr:uncharacterized protein LOC130987074 isoform X3 [Salvia miltiorrhiza]XP_057766650.1 uncharacterized protein LOC130987074 isoform X3 [Salvia miltiorrhiza]XP_057766651.1 uncharacterized protein LOC130987074 isoform X3 [Salvia miltiorrhiza]XP_057766652.1 uncharacterized protein LOC130987074 isoform X3 [Salvia miltiorrhiza]
MLELAAVLALVLGSLFLASALAFRLTTFYNSPLVVTTRGAWDVAQAGVVLGKKGLEGDGWGRISSNISEALQNPYQYVPFFSFKAENWKGNIVDFEGMKTSVASNAKQITDCFQRVGGRFSPWDGAGSKNL